MLGLNREPSLGRSRTVRESLKPDLPLEWSKGKDGRGGQKAEVP